MARKSKIKDVNFNRTCERFALSFHQFLANESPNHDRRHTGERGSMITDLAIAKAQLEASGFKRCNRCDDVLPRADFNFFLKRGVKRPFWCCRKCESVRHQELRTSGYFREKDLIQTNRRNARFPEKQVAKNAVVTALRNGYLTRPTACESCGATPQAFPSGKAAIEAHHPDYTKSLSVIWVCHPCHIKIHKADR